jgi:hypothetical protein
MRDRTEGHDLQAAMENLSLGCGKTPVGPNDVAGFSVRCPSCDHGNPAGSQFCNQCGMPVHFEACGRCEAINTRGAASCHKCGCVLPGHAVPESAAAAPAIVATLAAPAIVATLSAPAARPLDSSTDLPPDVVGAPKLRRHAGMRAALIALALAVVVVPTYIATEHPGSFQRVIDAVAPRGNVAADSPAPTSGPMQPSPVPAPSGPVNAQPVSPAGTSAAAAAAPQAASEPPSEIARDVKSPTAAASTAVAPPQAKRATPTTTKSNPSRSKQGTSSRKPPVRKPATKSS